MNNALAAVAYDSISKYAAVEVLHERAIDQTIHACKLLFPLESIEQISQATEVAWRLHVTNHAPLHDRGSRLPGLREVQANNDSPGDVLEHQFLREKLRQHLDDLSLRERQVIELRFGLLDNRCYSREEVGRRLRVTRERIRVIEERALRKLRDYLA